jgi:Ca2+-binding RTX toxin-like protein
MAVITGTNSGEPLDGTIYNDIIQGEGGDDFIFGNLGNDGLYGGDGNDIFLISGPSGQDYFYGGSGNDSIIVDDVSPVYTTVEFTIGWLDSVEMIASTVWQDVYIKGIGVIDLSGTDLIDIAGFRGSTGNDYLTGNVIYDSSTSTYKGIDIWGYDGNDELIGSSLSDMLDGGDGDDDLFGGAAGDNLIGGAGDDSLYGQAGDDALDGGSGSDILLGGAGDDVLTGGTGVDYFWFETGEGVDIVTDFEDGIDKIVIGSTISSINVYDYGGDALLEFDSGATYALLTGVAPTSIDGSDFLWA